VAEDSESVLPTGWLDDLFDKADLEGSFRALEGCEHFHAETMRGRIRSLQSRVREASDHFARSLALCVKEEKTIPTLLRRVICTVYNVENEILKGAVDRNIVPETWLPEVPRQVLTKHPKLGFALHLARAAEGLVRINVGDFQISKQIFTDLIETESTRPRESTFDVLAMYYLGLAASLHNLGCREQAGKNIENAELCVQSGGRLLNRARGAGCLYAFHTYLENRRSAQDWKAFLEQITCPRLTRDAFLDRGRLLAERCNQQANLVVF